MFARARAEWRIIKRENKPFDVEINKAEFVKKKADTERKGDRNVNTPTCARLERNVWRKHREKINEMKSANDGALIYIDSDESSHAKAIYTYTQTRGFVQSLTGANKALVLFLTIFRLARPIFHRLQGV